jgi:hypothetical protein
LPDDWRAATIGGMTRILVLALVAIALALPAEALAGRVDDDDVRVTARCSGRSTASLRLRRDDGALRVELRVETVRSGAPWRVVLLHDRRLAFRRALRTGGGGSLRVRRVLPDWFGRDTIVARATGPRGETCRASATI